MLFVRKSAKQIGKKLKKVKVTMLVKGQSSQKVALWISIWDIIMMWITINMDHTIMWHVSRTCGAVRKNLPKYPCSYN